MIPFRFSAGTSSHMTKMLVELLLWPVIFCGAPSGSDRKVENKLTLQ